MATPLIALAPYAAAAYCIARAGQHMWPSIKSTIGTAARGSTSAGFDGEADPIAQRVAQDCPGPRPSAAAYYTNPGNPYVRNGPGYCYNTTTGKLEGTGNLNGVAPPPSSVALWTDDDGTQLATINVAGDNTITVPLCGGPTRRTPPGTPQPPWHPPERTPPPTTRPPGGGGGGCGVERASPYQATRTCDQDRIMVANGRRRRWG